MSDTGTIFRYQVKISGDNKALVVNGTECKVDSSNSKVESITQLTLPELVRIIRGTKNVVGVSGKFKDWEYDK